MFRHREISLWHKGCLQYSIVSCRKHKIRRSSIENLKQRRKGQFVKRRRRSSCCSRSWSSFRVFIVSRLYFFLCVFSFTLALLALCQIESWAAHTPSRKRHCDSHTQRCFIFFSFRKTGLLWLRHERLQREEKSVKLFTEKLLDHLGIGYKAGESTIVGMLKGRSRAEFLVCGDENLLIDLYGHFPFL